MRTSRMSVFGSFAAIALALCIPALGFADKDEDSRTEKKKPADDEWKIYWSNSFHVESNDFKLQFGGRIMNDWAWGDAGADLPEFISSNEFRRARLFVEGEVYKHIIFKAQYDFAGGEVAFKDVYMGISDLPFGALKVGHFHVPFSLEEMTSSKYITFIERALPIELFAPSRQTGIGFYGAAGEANKEKVTWGFGVYTAADDFGGSINHDDAYLVAGRISFAPWMEGSDLFHLGAAAVFQDYNDATDARFRTRPEVHLYTRLIDTHSFPADSVVKVGLEGAAILGGFHAAGEYMMANIDSAETNDPSFQSFYVYGGWYLTGDHRNYKTSTGLFDRTKPMKPFDPDEGGMGAWEVAVRYSWADLNDGLVLGGEQNDVTVALNWYLTSNTVWRFNYVRADVKDLDDGVFNAFVARFQIDF